MAELLAFEDTKQAKEIIYLLDKAYPNGAEERLHNDWVEVIVDYNNKKEV